MTKQAVMESLLSEKQRDVPCGVELSRPFEVRLLLVVSL